MYLCNKSVTFTEKAPLEVANCELCIKDKMLKAGLLGSSRNTEKPQKAETKITDKQEQRLGNTD